MATFPALFDTNVLFGFHLNDVILGMAERGLFRPLWSERILAELSDNLVEHGLSPANAEKRIDAMRRAFPDATVGGFDDLIGTMTNDSKDRHVLAAGIRANCEVLVTFNLEDSPTRASPPTTSRSFTLTSSCSTNSTCTPGQRWECCAN
jgi:hypothetical protein